MSHSIEKSPLYLPHNVQNFNPDEDYPTIRSTCLKERRLWEDKKLIYRLKGGRIWRRPVEIERSPKFIKHKLSRFDAIQGQLGNCWLVAAMEGLTMHDELGRYVVPPNQSFQPEAYFGAFRFRIWKLNKWYEVVVDDRLPIDRDSGRLIYTHSLKHDVFWAALLEKAYLKIWGESEEPELSFKYESLKTGYCVSAMQDLSGGIIEVIDLDHLSPGTSLRWMLNLLNWEIAIVCCSRKDDIKDDSIQHHHSYVISRVFKIDDDTFLIRLMNPQGKHEWTGDWNDYDFINWYWKLDGKTRTQLDYDIDRGNGEFWMEEKDFASRLKHIWICHLGPGQFFHLHSVVHVQNWKTTFFNGSWISGKTSGGDSASDRFMNPQFRFKLDRSENDADFDGKCRVLIEITHLSKGGRYVKKVITFFIYSITNAINLPDPKKNPEHPLALGPDFFKDNKPIYDPRGDKQFGQNSVIGRSYHKAFLFDPGEYLIIPYTPDKSDADFLIRLFSESVLNAYEISDQVNKAPPTEEQSIDNIDDGLKTKFNKAAQGEAEINWVGLKQLLYEAMNPNSYFLATVSSLFKRIINIFFHSTTGGHGCFTKDECRKMIAMFDDDHSGRISFSEFINLWKKVCFWSEVFKNHSDDEGRCLKVSQLKDALSSIGYTINRTTFHSLSYLYADDEQNVYLEDFILCGVTLETILSYRERFEGKELQFTLEEWVKNCLMV